MIKISNYFTAKDKRYIENYCDVQIKNNDLIRVKSLASLMEGRYACFALMMYIKQDLKIDPRYIFHSEADYIFELPRGHIQLSNDEYFRNCYLHQYIVFKELNIPMEQVKKYIIHHQDQNKGNNDISNLWVFYDIASHVAYHQAIKHSKNVNIKEFTLDYIEGIADNKNVEDIRQYLLILDKLEAIQNDKKIYLCKHSAKVIA